MILAGTAAASPSKDWLSVCSQCLNPSVISSSGLGTANAVAQGRIDRADAESWCAQWDPQSRTCVRDQLASAEAKLAYRASADCTRGRITAVDGQTYAYAGIWSNDDIGGGRSRWRDTAGKIVGRDNASNGLAISQQWEVLCPKGLVSSTAARPTGGLTANGPIPGAAFAVGQAIEARYGRDWVRGKVTRVRPAGAELTYDVSLDNGQRGILPARMLRPAAAP
jgi:hypothetical protein